MPKLKPWYQVVTPREDLRSGKPLDASEFAVHLEHVREGRAPADYVRPERFFDRTFLTEPLRDLATQVVRRLSGERVETSAVFNMATQFGGGKTHALTVLYHLAVGGPAASAWQGVHGILSAARIASVPKAATAVFVGTEFDSISGRGGDDGTPRRLTPWGEIAWQLGGQAAFEVVARHDADGIAPAGDVLRRFLPSGPVLILMDELMNYVSRNRRTGLSAQLYNLIQNLGEEARARENVVLAVSVPASELEMNSEDHRDYESIKKLLDRLGRPVMMSADANAAEIIRRRLFEWVGLPEDGVRTVAEYSDWAIEHQQRLAIGDVDIIRERFRASYPFHPSVLAVFERKWQSLPRFQRTRGMLRLLALWVSQSYSAGYKGAHRDPLITLGTAPVEDPYFRAALFEQLGTDQLEGPVVTDIAGRSDSHAVRLDAEASNDIRQSRLHQKVATTILFESNGGMTRTEATTPEIRFDVGEPSLDVANVETVLEALGERSYYLRQDRTRYWYSVTPTLNKIVTDRRASVQASAIEERVIEEVQSVLRGGVPALSRVFFPTRSGDVPDRAALTLVVLRPEQSRSDPATGRLIEGIVREHGSSARTFKSALIFSVPDDGDRLSSDARNLLAWDDIAADGDTRGRLDASQERLLTTSQAKAARDLRESVWRCYKWVLLLGKDNQIKEADLGLVHSSSAASLAELIANQMRANDEITEAVGAARLVRYWPPAMAEWSTKAVRDSFYASPALPRLMNGDALRRTIADGVAGKLFGYAGKDASGRYDPLFFGESMLESDVEFSEDVFLLTAEEAKRVVEPPHLARVDIRPSVARLKPGAIATFAVDGYDQHGRPFPVDSAEWSADGGSVDAVGRYAAPGESGAYTVRVAAGDVVAAARVEVTARDERKPPDPDPTKKAVGLRWRGEVPPQKWMNLYTKVLSKFTRVAGLAITVEFSVPPGQGIGPADLDATRTSMRELGLNEDVDQG